MPTNNAPSPIRNPNIFSRGGLIHTFEFIRKRDPQLALTIRNITAGTPHPKTVTQADNKHTDYFTVTLDSFQVRAVVEILMEYGQTEGNETGSAVVARTLMEDWMRLARKMISDLPKGALP
ncbi:MAG: hypothetical protein COB30_007255 [Ectothiorhodospiraceae bacterium]|nr:hypothetical protein [Ectothiorhodospiraceae bacterium]